MDSENSAEMVFDLVSVLPAFVGRIIPVLVEESLSPNDALVGQACCAALERIREEPRFGSARELIPDVSPPPSLDPPEELRQFLALQDRYYGRRGVDDSTAPQGATFAQILAMESLLKRIVQAVGEQDAKPMLLVAVDRCCTAADLDLREVYLRLLASFPSEQELLYLLLVGVLRAPDEGPAMKFAAASVIASFGRGAVGIFDDLVEVICRVDSTPLVVKTLCIALAELRMPIAETKAALEQAASVHSHDTARTGIRDACGILGLGAEFLDAAC